ncbi:hypothetical protein AVEN_2385-1 [Araneus ventricosus]|uniref:Uncharacterized protein n=1 Tax=Araneus ventricosus TaxID=182803 RepID=A0A4Y2JND5_ARAVE|nr:hypothetical protein AVEN_2385-1 [Araneus ventricosus]
MLPDRINLHCDILFDQPRDTPSSSNENTNNLEAPLISVLMSARGRIEFPGNGRRLVMTPEEQTTILNRVIKSGCITTSDGEDRVQS